MNRGSSGLKVCIFYLGVLFIFIGFYILGKEKSIDNGIKNAIDKEMETHIVEVTSGSSVKATRRGKGKKADTEYTYKDVLEISEIDLVTPILSDTSRESLRKGVGHYEGTAELGGVGNCVLAGHSSNVYACVLNNLHKLKEGAILTVYDSNSVRYDYKVYEIIDNIDPYDTSVLEDIEGSTLTILTCTDSGQHRYAVRGIQQPSKI